MGKVLIYSFGGGGCLLLFLTVFNLFFGWMFLKPLYWFLTEFILIIIFLLSSYTFLKRVSSVKKRNNDIVDVEGKVIESD